jgi:hypothetical protein
MFYGLFYNAHNNSDYTMLTAESMMNYYVEWNWKDMPSKQSVINPSHTTTHIFISAKLFFFGGGGGLPRPSTCHYYKIVHKWDPTL